MLSISNTAAGMINGDENLDFQAAVNRLKTIYTEHLTIIQNQL